MARPAYSAWSRRRWLQTSSAVLASLGTVGFGQLLETIAAETRGGSYAPLNGFPRLVQDYYIQIVRELDQRMLQRQAELKTKADAERYVQQVREKIQQSFGPWPERTPLNARITGVVERDAYRIEKVIFESRPQFFVTANLYLPKGAKLPAPGVLGVCGHSNNGKAFDSYQAFSQCLVKQGYVVLIFDPIGQGERLQFPDEHLKPRIGYGTAEHTMLGNQQLLVGEFFGAWETWDGIRALDYLLSRPEVDPRHVGVTGSSGGGTQTTWLAGVERRFTMAAPNSFVTTFRRNLENELGADPEQFPPRCLKLGLEQADFLVAMAPNPVVVLAQELDNFDVRGSVETVARLKKIYALLGREENVKIHVGPEGHGYHAGARAAMFECFNRATGRPQIANEPGVHVEEENTLWCTKRGQVVDLKSRSVYSFTNEKSARLASQRPQLSGQALQSAVTGVLKLPVRNQIAVPEYRILRPRRGRGYPLAWFTPYALETEPGILAIVYRSSAEVHHARPPRQRNQAVLYVAHDSSDAELRDEPLVREVLAADPQATLYTCDVRGLGESRPNTCGENSYASRYGCDYLYASYGQMLDRPYVGGRTLDVLGVLDWIRGFGHASIHLVAKGYGAIPAACAALLHDGVSRVTLKNGLSSYAAIAASEVYKWPQSALLDRVLERFDLPDIYRELAAKDLRQIDPRGPEALRG